MDKSGRTRQRTRPRQSLWTPSEEATAAILSIYGRRFAVPEGSPEHIRLGKQAGVLLRRLGRSEQRLRKSAAMQGN